MSNQSLYRDTMKSRKFHADAASIPRKVTLTFFVHDITLLVSPKLPSIAAIPRSPYSALLM